MEDERITVTDALLKLESAARDALVAYDPSFKDPAVAGEDEIKDAVRLAFVKRWQNWKGAKQQKCVICCSPACFRICLMACDKGNTCSSPATSAPGNLHNEKQNRGNQ